MYFEIYCKGWFSLGGLDLPDHFSFSLASILFQSEPAGFNSEKVALRFSDFWFLAFNRASFSVRRNKRSKLFESQVRQPQHSGRYRLIVQKKSSIIMCRICFNLQQNVQNYEYFHWSRWRWWYPRVRRHSLDRFLQLFHCESGWRWWKCHTSAGARGFLTVCQ